VLHVLGRHSSPAGPPGCNQNTQIDQNHLTRFSEKHHHMATPFCLSPLPPPRRRTHAGNLPFPECPGDEALLNANQQTFPATQRETKTQRAKHKQATTQHANSSLRV
jgi:hypothetical protein